MAPYFINALRNELGEDSFYRRFANAADGEHAVITYSFMNKVPTGSSQPHGDPQNEFRRYTPAEMNTVRESLNMIEAVSGLTFKKTTGDADMNFGQFNMEDGTAGYAFYPLYNKADDEIVRGTNFGDIWLDSEYILKNVHLVLHEVGHALGLEHPFEGEQQLPTDEDNKDNTVMSYTGEWHNELGLYDIIALQSVYGPAHRRLGDDTYLFGQSKLIWDGGGTDKITAEYAFRSVTIDLHDGSWNHIGPKTSSFLDDAASRMQVFIGNFTRIENLTGSDFDDRLIGNEKANRINGGDGDDRINGDVGRDVLIGGKGSDDFIFASATGKSGRDHILDFSRRADDGLDLGGIDADTGNDRDSRFDFIGHREFSDTAGELRFEHKDGNTLVFADTDGDGRADFSIAIHGKVDLREGDFVL